MRRVAAVQFPNGLNVPADLQKVAAVSYPAGTLPPRDVVVWGGIPFYPGDAIPGDLAKVAAVRYLPTDTVPKGLRKVALVPASGFAAMPSQVAGLLQWMAADHVTGVASGSAFGTLTDLSGNGNNGTPSGSPTWVANAQNGRPAFRFAAASSQFVACNGVAASLGGDDTPFTVVAVVKKASNGAAHTLLGLGDSVDGDPLHVCRTNADASLGVFRRDAAGTGSGTLAGGSIDTAAHVLNFVFTGTACTVSKDGVKAIDNQALDLGTLGAVNRCTIGALVYQGAATGTSFYDGDIFEWAVFSGARSAGELTQLNRYLGRKYGITVA